MTDRNQWKRLMNAFCNQGATSNERGGIYKLSSHGFEPPLYVSSKPTIVAGICACQCKSGSPVWVPSIAWCSSLLILWNVFPNETGNSLPTGLHSKTGKDEQIIYTSVVQWERIIMASDNTYFSLASPGETHNIITVTHLILSLDINDICSKM